MIDMVEAEKKGSIWAVVGSGMRVMSDSLIAFQPAMEEPSNMMPSANSVFIDDADVESDVLPLAARVGETEIDILTSLSLIALSTSLAVCMVVWSSSALLGLSSARKGFGLRKRA